MLIELKRKYRHGMQYKSQKSTSGNSGHTKRHKLGQEAKKLLPRQPAKVMLMNHGRCRMVLLSEVQPY